MYWPEELPVTAKAADDASPILGRRRYHGKTELIASNHFQVTDVTAFAGKADVEHFNEILDDHGVSDPDPNKFYWRQTFCPSTQRLSVSCCFHASKTPNLILFFQDLPSYCICNGHYNPDIHEYTYICDNKACQTMYHPECLVEDTLTRKYYEEYPQNGTETTTNGANYKNKKSKTGKSKQKIYSEVFKGQLVDDYNSQTPPMIKVTDIRSTLHTETLQRVICPKCSTLFE